MENRKLNKEDCIIILKSKYDEMLSEGLTRYPQRSDFSDAEVVAIKSFLGPWPRALEAAGIKEARDDDRAEKNKEKRIRAKQAKIAAIKQEKNNVKNTNNKNERGKK